MKTRKMKTKTRKMTRNRSSLPLPFREREGVAPSLPSNGTPPDSALAGWARYGGDLLEELGTGVHR
jgi:hypothetical protein